MRRVATFLLAAVLVLAVADAAGAAPTSSDPTTAARDGAAWLAARVNAQGFIPSSGDPSKPDYGTSTEAVVALAGAGVGGTTIESLMTYLGAHVEANINHGGVDDPGAIANLILAAVASGANPTSFGVPATNLVNRLLATQQASGLFGSADATFDGAFRQGLSLLALHAAGVGNASGVAWLEDQQCANGLWMALRDPKDACLPVDPATFTGPDTNSTALAVLGLHAQGASGPASDGVAALDAVRTADGGWSYLASSDQTTDADSTADVLDALRTVNGTVDIKGRDALFSLQLGCDAAVADRGAFAFQAGAGGSLDANLLASVQAVTAAAGVALPVVDASATAGVPTACVTSAPSTTTTTTVASLGSTTPTSAAATTGTVAAAETLPRTGSSSGLLMGIGVVAVLAGAALALGGRRRA